MVMKSKKVYIIDYIGNSFEGKPIGHPHKVIIQIRNLISNSFDVNTALPKVYEGTIPIDIYLPHYCDLHQRNMNFYRLKCFFLKFKNLKYIFSINKDDILLFANIDFSLYLFLALSKRRENVIAINYFNYANLRGFLGTIKKKIHLIAKNKMKVELNTYNFNDNEFVPDYYYESNEERDMKEEEKVDFLVIGTMNEAKDIISLINALKGSNFKLKIVGKFFDEDYYKNALKTSENSENIVIINKYLNSYEYKQEIINSRYVVLPYKTSIYNNLTSGVFLDALYNNIPIICPNTHYFNQFKSMRIGIVYENINEIISLVENDDYSSYQKSIIEFNTKLSEKTIRKKIIDLLK